MVVLAVEVKSALKVGDVKEFILKIDHFFEFFEEYRGSEVLGVVAGISIVDWGFVQLKIIRTVHNISENIYTIIDTHIQYGGS